MCSASEILRALAIAIAIPIAACDKSPPDAVSMSAPPPMPRPVGPIPGPAEDVGAKTKNPYGGDPMAVQQGYLYFNRFNCSGCHGDHGGGGMGPSLRDADWLYGNTDAQIFASITEGRGHGMPAWGVKITEEIAWKIVAYLRTMRTSDEPNPPDQTVPKPPEIPAP